MPGNQPSRKPLHGGGGSAWPEFNIEPPLTHPFDSKQLARVLDERLRTGITSHTQSMESVLLCNLESPIFMEASLARSLSCVILVTLVQYLQGQISSDLKKTSVKFMEKCIPPVKSRRKTNVARNDL